LIQSIQQQAIRETAKVFKENGIGLLGIQDLFHRDEDGTVHFDNPDVPGREFNSRAEAQQWLDSFNKNVREEWEAQVRRHQSELYKKAAPSIRLLEFAPAYDAMDENTKAVFNDLVEPYSVYDENNQLIGYSCNLNAVANQAQKIASRFSAGTQQGTEQAKQPVKQPKKGSGNLPDMDAKTSGGDGRQMYDPKNIEEAMALSAKLRKEMANG